LGDLSEIQPPPGFYKRVSHKIGQTPNKRLLGSHWRNWGSRALPSPAFAFVILAIGIFCGSYIGNSLMQLKPSHSVAASSEGSFLGSLRVFDPAPPGTLADGYERLLSYNESHAK
jgi:hypothetical protein